MGYKEFLFELFDQNLIFQEGARSSVIEAILVRLILLQVTNGKKPGQP